MNQFHHDTDTDATNVFMVDIETAGLTYGSAILQIAAAEFNPLTGEILREWDTDVSLLDCNRHGLTTDPATVVFHMRHGNSFTSGMELWRALNTLYVFLHLKSDDITVWAWGLDFETLHLKAASSAAEFGAEAPWKYWQGRDARTIWQVAFPGKKAPKRPHNAALDVRAQVADLHAALSRLRNAQGDQPKV